MRIARQNDDLDCSDSGEGEDSSYKTAFFVCKIGLLLLAEVAIKEFCDSQDLSNGQTAVVFVCFNLCLLPMVIWCCKESGDDDDDEKEDDGVGRSRRTGP